MIHLAKSEIIPINFYNLWLLATDCLKCLIKQQIGLQWVNEISIFHLKFESLNDIDQFYELPVVVQNIPWNTIFWSDANLSI